MDMMIDIETLGTNENAVITQIGACFFDRDGKVYDKFSVNISIANNLAMGREVDAGALKFWLENRHAITWLKEPIALSKALNDLGKFYKGCDKSGQVWSHTFDQVILAHAYRLCLNSRMPWGYRNQRDIRTLVDLADLKVKKEDIKADKTHDGLDDCIYQVEYCCKAFKKLRGENIASKTT